MSHEEPKCRAIFNFGYTKYVMDLNLAMELFAKFRGLEMLKTEYKDGKSVTFIEHLPESHITLGYLSEEEYATCKLVGKARQLQEQEK